MDITDVLKLLDQTRTCSPNTKLGRTMQSLFEDLTGESDLYDPLQMATDAFVDDVAVDSDNRARMVRKTSLYEYADLNRDHVRGVIAELGGLILGSVPESVSDSDNQGHQTFDVRLLDVMSDPAKLVTKILSVFLSNDLQNTALFFNLRLTLADNIEYVHQNVRKQATPEDLLKDHSIEDIIRLFLRGTCFENLFALTVPFVIAQKVRFEHMHIVAGSGHGKTQALQYIISRDIEEVQKGKMGFAVIDSQGDLIEEILKRKAIHDLQDKVILVDPNDIAYPPSLNMFDVGLSRSEQADPVEREKIINGTIDLYSYIFSSLLGAELTQKQGVIFTYLARMMMVIPNANIFTLRELVEDGNQFREHFDKLDPSSRHFFEKQFFGKTFSATRQQVLTRLWGVLSNSTFEKMFSARESKIDLFDAMNDGKIVLINTAKDLLKAEGCSIFGRFFIALIAQAALSRSVLPIDKRKPFVVTIDEAHDYFDDKIEDIANQARKFNVGLTLSHQNLDQANAKLRASIMSSTSIKMAGGVSAKDAQVLAQNMHTSPDTILNAKKRKQNTQFACYVRNVTDQPVLIDIPFGVLEAMPICSEQDRETLKEANRKRVCQSSENDGDSMSSAIKEEPKEPNVGEGNEEDKKEKVAETLPQTGKGGSVHKAIQHKLANAASDNNIQSQIEAHIGEGKHVDVMLYNGSHTIACEISVSTSVTHELENIQKCLATDADAVWVVSEDADWRHRMQEQLTCFEQADNVTVGSPEDVIAFIQSLPKDDKLAMVNGRRVQSTWKELPQDQRTLHETVLAKILTGRT